LIVKVPVVRQMRRCGCLALKEMKWKRKEPFKERNEQRRAHEKIRIIEEIAG